MKEKFQFNFSEQIDHLPYARDSLCSLEKMRWMEYSLGSQAHRPGGKGGSDRLHSKL